MTKRTGLFALGLAIASISTVLHAAETYSHQGGGASGINCGPMKDWISGGGGNYTYLHGSWEVAGPEGGSLYAELNGRSNAPDDGHLFDGLADSFGSIHGRCDL